MFFSFAFRTFLPTRLTNLCFRAPCTLLPEQNILSSYNAVGIFEEWDLSMDLFNATVKSSVRSWDATVFLNGGVVPGERAELLEWAYLSPEINVALAADMMLYDYAVILFRRQTSAVLGKKWE